MMQLNFENVEELIFTDEAAQLVLPSYFFNYFESWRLAKRMPALRQLGKTAILDFLSSIRDEHIAVLEQFFGEKIVVEKLNYNTVQNIKIPIFETEACRCLCELAGNGQFSLYRDDQYVYVTFWR